MYDYKVGNSAKGQFELICPKSYRRCNNNHALVNFKLIRMYDLGKKIAHEFGDTYDVSHYNNLLIIRHVANNELVGIKKAGSPQYIHNCDKDEYTIGYMNHNNLETIREQGEVGYVAYFDGSYKVIKGKMGIGYSIYYLKGSIQEVVFEYSEVVDDPNNKLDSYFAEAIALKKCLEKIDELQIKKINIKGDNLPLIMQVNGLCSANRKILPYVDACLHYITDKKRNIQIDWVSRNHNTIAHKLAAIPN